MRSDVNEIVMSLRYESCIGVGRPIFFYRSRDHACSASGAFVRSRGVRPLRRHSSAPAAFVRSGYFFVIEVAIMRVQLRRVRPLRRRSSASTAFVRPGDFVRLGGIRPPRRLRPPRRRSSAPAAFVRPGGVRSQKRSWREATCGRDSRCLDYNVDYRVRRT